MDVFVWGTRGLVALVCVLVIPRSGQQVRLPRQRGSSN